MSGKWVGNKALNDETLMLAVKERNERSEKEDGTRNDKTAIWKQATSKMHNEEGEDNFGGDQKLLIDKAFKLAVMDMEKAVKKINRDVDDENKGKEQTLKFWEKESRTVEEMDASSGAIDKLSREKLRNYIKQKIKKLLLIVYSNTGNKGKNDDVRDTKKKTKNNEEFDSDSVMDDDDNAIINLDDISYDETVVTSSSGKKLRRLYRRMSGKR